MRQIKIGRSLAEQVYDAIVDDICDGALPPATHLRQEELAERLGVSRQPIQQAMVRLKADGMVEERGRRGLFVTLLDRTRMRQHYGVRAALDGYAARIAAEQARLDDSVALAARRDGRAILDAGDAAVAAGAIAEQIRQDEALHQLIYALSGNPMLGFAAEPHWRFLRRAMGDVLRQAEQPRDIWDQHAVILDAVIAGDSTQAERLALAHVEIAADLLAKVLEDETPDAASPPQPESGNTTLTR